MRYEGSISDIPALKIGHYTDEKAQTGCTVVLCEGGAVCGVDVRGAAPGTRETDLLRGYNLVDRVHAVLLTGGSAFGLSAADGVMRYLERRGVGFDTGFAKVPIVPAAVLYDLSVGDASVRPDADAGEAACQDAERNAQTNAALAQGRVGAGTGAIVGKLLGAQYAQRGGIGTASVALGNGVFVTAIIAVNAAGDIVDHTTGNILEGARDENGRFLDCVGSLLSGIPEKSAVGTNTTIGVVATNARLDREQSNRLATVAHDGLAMTIRPVHTQYDGDTLFGLSTGEIAVESLLPVFVAAVEATARAVVNAVAPDAVG